MLQQVGSCYACLVAVDQDKDAADPSQVPLHLQPARLVSDMAGHAPYQGRRVQGHQPAAVPLQARVYKGRCRQVRARSCLTVEVANILPTTRFTNEEDKLWFEKALVRLVKEKVDDKMSVEGTEPYFVDFLRDAPEATGEEADDSDLEAPKIYEQVRSAPPQEVMLLPLASMLDVV
ncbi:unnamed protein product [Clavelina lepadiformis]|uniref:Uncharacterized protein n=1 Tax=Clavelina lepadiformis TaxID=159417 RepID=A0ABP0FRX7_CLALP